MYNQFVQGNAELLSISSNDSIWNSDDKTEETSNAAPRNNPSKHSTSKISKRFMFDEIQFAIFF